MNGCGRGVFQLAIFFLFSARSIALADAPNLTGYISIEPRVFLDDPLFSEQPDAGFSNSVVLAPELDFEWNDGSDRVTVSPFLRFDADDDERTHADLRELLWLRARDPWTMRIGIGRVFWGVTESRHLVDVINQTDQVEDLDEEDKLGQQLISLERWSAKTGSFSVFLLPGFRERRFPARDARLRGTSPIDTGRTEYESSARSRRIDWALRWSHAIGGWDLGASIFKGTSREPVLLPRLGAMGEGVLIPRYDIITQAGVDIQYTKNSWLWKLEAIERRGYGTTFGAFVAGFEFTLFSLGSRGVDVGILAEFLSDGRNAMAPQTTFDSDWFTGIRIGLNDVQDTRILLGAILDDTGSFGVVEAERRIADSWKFEAEARLFLDVERGDPVLGGFRNDSVVTLRLARYF